MTLFYSAPEDGDAPTVVNPYRKEPVGAQHWPVHDTKRALFWSSVRFHLARVVLLLFILGIGAIVLYGTDLLTELWVVRQ
jgi:hypothetical protein